MWMLALSSVLVKGTSKIISGYLEKYHQVNQSISLMAKGQLQYFIRLARISGSITKI